MRNILYKQGPIPIFLGGYFLSIGRSETSSYTDTSTILTSSSPLLSYCSTITHLIDRTYKALVHTDASNNPLLLGYANYSKYFKFDLGTSKHIKTVFVVNLAWNVPC